MVDKDFHTIPDSIDMKLLHEQGINKPLNKIIQRA